MWRYVLATLVCYIPRLTTQLHQLRSSVQSSERCHGNRSGAAAAADVISRSVSYLSYFLTRLIFVYYLGYTFAASEAGNPRQSSLGGKNLIKPSPIYPHFSLLPMHFQCDGPNTAASTSVDRLWWLIHRTTPLGGHKGCLTEQEAKLSLG